MKKLKYFFFVRVIGKKINILLIASVNFSTLFLNSLPLPFNGYRQNLENFFIKAIFYPSRNISLTSSANNAEDPVINQFLSNLQCCNIFG